MTGYSPKQQNETMYRLSEDARNKVYQMFDKTEKIVSEDVEIVKDWIKSQPHLPEVMDDAKIRNFLQLNKFDLERTKEKIDSYYTIRTKIPDFFEAGNPKLSNIKRVFETTYCFTHPKPIGDIHRVIFLKMKEPNIFSPLDLVKLCLCIFEIRLFEDCMVDDIIVFDLANLTFKDMSKISPRFVYKSFSVYKNVFSLRLKALYFLNSPFYVSVWMALMKFIVKQKIFDRVQVHRDCEVVKELFDSKDVPKDYGGDGPTMEEFNEMMRRKLDEYQERFDQMDSMKVDERLRPRKN